MFILKKNERIVLDLKFQDLIALRVQNGICNIEISTFPYPPDNEKNFTFLASLKDIPDYKDNYGIYGPYETNRFFRITSEADFVYIDVGQNPSAHPVEPIKLDDVSKHIYFANPPFSSNINSIVPRMGFAEIVSSSDHQIIDSTGSYIYVNFSGSSTGVSGLYKILGTSSGGGSNGIIIDCPYSSGLYGGPGSVSVSSADGTLYPVIKFKIPAGTMAVGSSIFFNGLFSVESSGPSRVFDIKINGTDFLSANLANKTCIAFSKYAYLSKDRYGAKKLYSSNSSQYGPVIDANDIFEIPFNNYINNEIILNVSSTFINDASIINSFIAQIM